MAQVSKKNIDAGGVLTGITSSIKIVSTLFVIYFFLKGYFSRKKKGKGILQGVTDYITSPFSKTSKEEKEEKIKKETPKMTVNEYGRSVSDERINTIIERLDTWFSSFIDPFTNSELWDMLEPLNEDDFAYLYDEFGVKSYEHLLGVFTFTGNLYDHFDQQLKKSTKELIYKKTASFIAVELHYIPA